jgi:hypothetical protein
LLTWSSAPPRQLQKDGAFKPLANPYPSQAAQASAHALLTKGLALLASSGRLAGCGGGDGSLPLNALAAGGKFLLAAALDGGGAAAPQLSAQLVAVSPGRGARRGGRRRRGV